MLTRTEFHELVAASPTTAVSLYLPTHAGGRDVRQNTIRLKNQLATARDLLADDGVVDPAALLGEATALLDDDVFWQQLDAGLAVFIDASSTRHHALPQPVVESVVVGQAFAVRPLLPMLGADGPFAVLTVTERDAALRRATRYTLDPAPVTELPEHPLRAGVESDYENPVNASPPHRPHVGVSAISNAQVYGDSPPEFRKTRLVAYAVSLAKAVDGWLTSNPMPLVIVADAEIGGHLLQSDALRRHLGGVVESNPAHLSDGAVQRAAYAEVAARFARDLDLALDRAMSLLGRLDARAISNVKTIVQAAAASRIDTLIVADGGREAGGSRVDDDPVESAIHGTVLGGGTVHVADASRLPAGVEAVAVLRY